MLDSRGTRRRPRGVAWTASCRDDTASLGVGGDGRATVLPEEEDTGDNRGSFPGEDICSNEKQAGRLTRLRDRLVRPALPLSDLFSEVTSLSSVSALLRQGNPKSDKASSSSVDEWEGWGVLCEVPGPEEEEVEDMRRWTVGTVDWLLVPDGRRV